MSYQIGVIGANRRRRLKFWPRMTRRIRSLNKPKYEILILGGLGDSVSHREATHLTGSCRGGTALLISATILRICLNRIGGASAIE